MTKKAPPISDEDRRLFRSTVKRMSPTPQDKFAQDDLDENTNNGERAITAPVLPSTAAIDYRYAPVTADQKLFFAIPGVAEKTLKRLRQGKLPIQASIDLHGHSLLEATNSLLDFFRYSYANHFQIIRIIHGKGSRTNETKPILKSALNTWLREVSCVAAFCSAQPRDGGTGAIYLLLKK